MIVINRGHARLLAAATIGTLVEWYEFFIFSACAVLVFDKVFFPFTDRLTGIILGLTTYSVGFLARPLGGVLFGRLGDRFGRKRALVLSFSLMGVATFCMGL